MRENNRLEAITAKLRSEQIMTGKELLVEAVELFLDHVDYCLDNNHTMHINAWYFKLNKALDVINREKSGLPPAPTNIGRPPGSLDRQKRRPRHDCKDNR